MKTTALGTLIGFILGMFTIISYAVVGVVQAVEDASGLLGD